MASFAQHVNGAVITTGVVIVPLHSASLLDVSQSLIALALGLIGGILPDLDSDNSTPLQIVFKIFSIFLPLIILLSFFGDSTLLELMGYWVLASLFLHLTIFRIFTSITVHRGIFHTIPMGVLFGQIITYIFYNTLGYEILFATLAGLFLFLGYMIHLLLDELVSLNALGLRMKKSFGTAFKLYEKENLFGTLILYILVIGFFFILPMNTDIFMEILEVLKGVRVY